MVIDCKYVASLLQEFFGINNNCAHFRHILDFEILPNDRVIVTDVASKNELITPIPGLEDTVLMISQEGQVSVPRSESFPPFSPSEGGLICSESIAAVVVQQLCRLILNQVQLPA